MLLRKNQGGKMSKTKMASKTEKIPPQGPGIMIAPQIQVIQVTTHEGKAPVHISLLLNAVYFFLQCVFIMRTEKGYRLIVVHQNRLLTDRTYKTFKGARIAFSKLWSYKAWESGVKPEWSLFYPPEPSWLSDRMKALLNVSI
jgi:hypothetical protein